MSSSIPSAADATDQRVDSDRRDAEDRGFPVVGIGASVGGIDACQALLHELRPDTGMAFIVVLHLSRAHPGMLPEILSRETKLRVAEVTDGCVIEPDRVYVIPADVEATAETGRLRTAPRADISGHPRTIDTLFRSLAQERGYKAIGIVLSGTSTDGTLGLEEIKAAGGITFAQDSTAQHGSMPRSAIAAGCVDYVLPPDGIAAELGRIAHHPYVAPVAEAEDVKLEPVLDVLNAATGVDFRHYKPNTLQRRITRRMLLHRLDDVQSYAAMLKTDPGEVDSLYQDVLIGVTSFFRNPECFEALKTTVFARLVAHRTRHDPIRVWVIGCSTGEEAYSIAIVLAEAMEAMGKQWPVQVFATDVNSPAIAKARNGFYSGNIAQDVSAQRLRAYFTECDGGYRINESIRDMCIFARHNLIAEPPFSRIDLVTCRNLLIYLAADMQQRIMPTLHFALKPNGFLLLGASETVGSYRDRFDVEDARHKIYRKKGLSTREFAVPLPQACANAGDRAHAPAAGGWRDTALAIEMYTGADRMRFAKYAPPSVLVNRDFDTVEALKPLAAGGAEAEIARLKQELDATRACLQAVIEQQEAAIEEMQSANEELQSVNEELETSKKELRSSNEELATVNEELHNRNVELGEGNDDLVNLLSSVQIAIVTLGRDLTIRRFTPCAEKLLSLMPADVGRPIDGCKLNIAVPYLEERLEEVIDSVTATEFEVQDAAGHWYLLRMRPYRTVGNKVDGALMMLVDIDALKRGQEQLRRHAELLDQVVDPTVMWELDAGIVYWNRAATETYGYTPEEALGRLPYTLLATTPPFAEFRDALLRDGRWAGVLTHTRRDGRRIRVESRMSVVCEHDRRTIVVETARPAQPAPA